MEGIVDLPMDKAVGCDVDDLFNWKSKIHEHDKQGNEGIAMVQDSEDKMYYVIVYHYAGMVIPTYSQKFDGMLGAMVVYDKLKKALISGTLEAAFHAMIRHNQKKRKL